MSHHKHSPNTERAAECQRLIEELRDFTDEMNDKEKGFVIDMDDRLSRYGEATYVSDSQFSWLSEIYRRIIG
jgi:hypothetical protein